MSALRAVGVSGSPAAASRSALLVERVLAHLAREAVATALVSLVALPADALLARRRDAAVDEAIGSACAAEVLVLGTPVYRATYTGQLKAFFDLFPQDALRGRAVGLVATGASLAHLLAVDHGLRPLVASLGGLTAARAVYATDDRLPREARIPDDIDEELRALAGELVALARALRPAGVAVQAVP